jgi:hypothetical protein
MILLFQAITYFKEVNYNPKALSLANCIGAPEFIETVGAVSNAYVYALYLT